MRQPIVLHAPDALAFAPYGRFVTPPDLPGTRAFYSDAFAAHPGDTAAVVHVNHVPESRLPLMATQVERHPHAAQCFIPLDVARYAVVVMPSDAEGDPVPARALGFMVPGSVGVIYNPGVWHLGATVFDRTGHFAVLMWRGGAAADDEFRTIPEFALCDAAAAIGVAS
jgi:ureidoglycolate lyase